MALDVLYLDNHVLAVLKPPGLVTQPSGHHRDSLENRAKAYLKERFHKPGAVFLEAVHRLDRPAAGVVLFARTSKAISRLAGEIRSGRAAKTYLGVVEGRVSPAAGRRTDWLVHGSHQARVVAPGTAGARQATLTYEVLASAAGLSLVRIHLLTGRYHQIRVQFSAFGHPLCGDQRYGSIQPEVAGGIALLHWELRIMHPVRQEPLTLRAPLPQAPPWTVFAGLDLEAGEVSDDTG